MSAEKYEHIHRNRKHIFLNNFLGGLSWGLGASVGVSLLFALLGYIATQANLVPYVGGFVSEVIDFVIQHNQNLQR